MFALLLAACTSSTPVDTGPATADVADDTSPPACVTPELHITGEDPPHVGDAWAVWLWCDGSLQLGPTRLSFDPPEVATISDNNATFIAAGDATMEMQVGSIRQSRDVTISE